MESTSVRHKVLLIDDTSAILHILNEILRNDYDTVIAKTGEKGIASAKKFMPDLILLDVVMPEMSGYEVLEALKSDEHTRNIAVVLMSGKDSSESEVMGYSLGAIDYIRKPFDPIVVKHRVDFNMEFIAMKDELNLIKSR